MADPISVASGLLTLVAFALSSSNTLLQSIKTFKSHQRSVRELREEVEALEVVLQTLQASAGKPTIDLSALKLPLLRCGRACEDFAEIIAKCASHSNGSRTSFRDWAKLRYMGDDITGFKNMLAGYKSTIAIALGDANIRTTTITADVLKQYQELIQNTTSDLEEHLREIDNKLAALSSLGARIPDGDAAERQRIQEERESTQQCLDICIEVAHHVVLAQSKATVDAGIAFDQATATPEGHFSARVLADETLKECKNKLDSTTARLQRNLEDLNKRLQRIYLEAPEMVKGDLTDREKIREEIESVRQCLAICNKATDQAASHRTNIFENVSMADDGHQVIVSTLGDLISAKHIVVGARSVQWLGQMSDTSLQQLSRDRGPQAAEKPLQEKYSTGTEFENLYGTGHALVATRPDNAEKTP